MHPFVRAGGAGDGGCFVGDEGFDKEGYLGEFIVAVAVEDIGVAQEAGTVVVDDGFSVALKTVQADLGKDGPAEAFLYHLKGGEAITGVPGTGSRIDMYFEWPGATTTGHRGDGCPRRGREIGRLGESW